MKKDNLQERLRAVSAQAAEQNQGRRGEARMLFDELTGEVKRQAEIEREDDRRRSLFVKILLVLTLVSALSAAVVGGYGIYNFPDAPLRQNGEAYTGKHGQPRTKEDFEKFVLWQKALFVGFGSTFFFAFAFALTDSREKRRRKSAE